ncbi:helix-turn-helix transcriptional regulator [Vibrio alginolyticus]|nr:WYL domain-containing protein [Vibrio alginolyticus]ELA9390879.1 WYL domain-containing protein [Vibrio parahaemolyticus]MDF4880688.1 WYL domain-containing protein [Vibrio parahaemolyticus]
MFELYYLVATKVGQRNVPQLFNVSRMLSVELLESKIEKPVTFDLGEYSLSNPTSWLISSNMEQIKLKVRGFVYHWLMHNELSTTQRISATDKEWTTVTPESHVTYDLVGWILRFSTDVITVKPIILVDEVLYRLSSLTVLYEQEG